MQGLRNLGRQSLEVTRRVLSEVDDSESGKLFSSLWKYVPSFPKCKSDRYLSLYRGANCRTKLSKWSTLSNLRSTGSALVNVFESYRGASQQSEWIRMMEELSHIQHLIKGCSFFKPNIPTNDDFLSLKVREQDIEKSKWRWLPLLEYFTFRCLYMLLWTIVSSINDVSPLLNCTVLSSLNINDRFSLQNASQGLEKYVSYPSNFIALFLCSNIDIANIFPKNANNFSLSSQVSSFTYPSSLLLPDLVEYSNVNPLSLFWKPSILYCLSE